MGSCTGLRCRQDFYPYNRSFPLGLPRLSCSLCLNGHWPVTVSVLLPLLLLTHSSLRLRHSKLSKQLAVSLKRYC